MSKRQTPFGHAESLQMETGATGLEPATSGVTGRARATTILPATTRKSLLSRCFGEAQSTGLYDSARPSTMASPHPRPIGPLTP
jgi:hypothetical protein